MDARDSVVMATVAVVSSFRPRPLKPGRRDLKFLFPVLNENLLLAVVDTVSEVGLEMGMVVSRLSSSTVVISSLSANSSTAGSRVGSASVDLSKFRVEDSTLFLLKRDLKFLFAPDLKGLFLRGAEGLGDGARGVI